MVANTNPSQGTATAYTFVTACVITDGLRLTVAVEPLAARKQLPETLAAVIEQTRAWVGIRRVFLDRGFYRVTCLQGLQELDVPFVVRAPVFSNWAAETPQIQIEYGYRTTQSNPPYEWAEHTDSRCLTHRIPRRSRPSS